MNSLLFLLFIWVRAHEQCNFKKSIEKYKSYDIILYIIQGVGFMQVSSGIAYFGNNKMQGTLKNRIQNAIESDITSIQIRISDVKDFSDFDGYHGDISCYIDDVKWEEEYFKDLEVKLAKLKVLGTSSVVIPTMMAVSKYKAMNHDDKLNLLKHMSAYIVNIANKRIKVGLLNTCDGVFIGTVILPIIYNLYPQLVDKVGYAVNISETSDGGIAELDFRSVNTVNIKPVVENGNIIYDRSRALIGNVYSEFVKFGYVPNMFTVADNVPLAVVTNLASLCSSIVSFVISKIGGIRESRGNVRGKSMSGYHATGVSEKAAPVGKSNKENNFGFVDCMQLFMILSFLCLIGVLVMLVLVLL